MGSPDAGRRGVVVGLPAYFYPWPGGSDWSRLGQLDREMVVVVDPATGPGGALDHAYEAALAEDAPPGAVLLGYVDDAHGERPPEDILDEVRRYAQWYGVDGVFLDRTRADSLALRRLRPLCEEVRALGLRVALNPGQPEVDPRYFDVADHVVLFEGDLRTYRAVVFRAWVHHHDPGRIWHLVHGVPEGALDEVASLADQGNAGILFATDRALPDPWSGLPSFWPRQPSGPLPLV